VPKRIEVLVNLVYQRWCIKCWFDEDK